ncbi:MAG TPA: shikimate kinase [Acidimicrobiia bacterium]|nr:shikimate kinase [Acidimicrobiia bacterium]
MRHLWLIGMMGSGKSEVGRRVAELTGFPFVDLDERVVANRGQSISEIFAGEGEIAFRRLERDELRAAADEDPAVIATGGGVITGVGTSALMRASGTVLYLAAEPATLARRVGADSHRPLLTGGDRVDILTEILRLRAPLYEAAAHHTIDTENHTIDEVAGEAIGLWNRS